MKDDTYRSQFRLPYPLYEKLKASAEQSNRSLNAEIVDRLQKSLDGEEGGQATLSEIYALLQRVADQNNQSGT